MARLEQGFLGPFNGKVGGAIAATWKGINYIKGYVIPANPNSPAQQAQRSKFGNVVKLAQGILPTLITTFLNPIAIKMSGYNFFIQQFINTCDTNGLALPTSLVTKGNLEPTPSILSASYNTATGLTTVVFDSAIFGNGELTDQGNGLVLNKTTNKVVGYGTNLAVRDHEDLAIPGIDGENATDLIAYIWFARGTGSTFTISNSVGKVCVAA